MGGIMSFTHDEYDDMELTPEIVRLISDNLFDLFDDENPIITASNTGEE